LIALQQRRKALKDAGVTRLLRLLEDAIDRDQVVISSAELLEEAPERLASSEPLARIKGSAAENAEMLRSVCRLLYEDKIRLKDASGE
jgi:hypothetical protein